MTPDLALAKNRQDWAQVPATPVRALRLLPWLLLQQLHIHDTTLIDKQKLE